MIKIGTVYGSEFYVRARSINWNIIYYVPAYDTLSLIFLYIMLIFKDRNIKYILRFRF